MPVFDTLRVMTMRICNHVSPFHPDKTHLHHSLLAIGTSHSITSVVEISINIGIAGLWYLSKKFGASQEIQLYVVVLAAALLVWGLFFFLNYHTKHETPFLHKLQKFTKCTHFGKRGWWLNILNFLDKRVIE